MREHARALLAQPCRVIQDPFKALHSVVAFYWRYVVIRDHD